jgi:5-methylcytosine-specific restriction endonuclease McrA
MDVHLNVCKSWLKQIKYSKEEQIRRGYNYIQNDQYLEKDGNVYNNYHKNPSQKWNYIGRLRVDGSIDKSAPAVQKSLTASDGGQCALCENTYADIITHIRGSHVCLWCHASAIKNKSDHMRSCKEYIKWDAEPAVPQEAAAKKKKERIPAHIKTIVWRTYIGNEKPEAKCYCCKHETVDIRNFECGHVVAEAKGGPLTVDNLRPICRGCNGAMGTMSMEEYCQKFFGRSVAVKAAPAVETKAPAETKAAPAVAKIKAVDDVFGLFTELSTPDQLVVDPFADLLG